MKSILMFEVVFSAMYSFAFLHPGNTVNHLKGNFYHVNGQIFDQEPWNSSRLTNVIFKNFAWWHEQYMEQCIQEWTK